MRVFWRILLPAVGCQVTLVLYLGYGWPAWLAVGSSALLSAFLLWLTDGPGEK